MYVAMHFRRYGAGQFIWFDVLAAELVQRQDNLSSLIPRRHRIFILEIDLPRSIRQLGYSC